MGDDPSDDIISALESQFGCPVRISGLRPLTSGASRQSWRFEVHRGGDAPAAYVLQRDMVPGMRAAPGDFGPLSMETQAQILRAALSGGVPVPAVVASGEIRGRQYIIADWLDGEALPPKMLRDDDLAAGREKLMEDCASALAAIHRLPPAGLGLASLDRLEMYRQRLEQMGEPRPVLELGYRWLAEHKPQPGRQVVVHGDFRLGNLLVGRNGLQAVLDWEMTHLGDPHEDVAWATIRAWRFDRYREPGIFPEPEEWARAYDSAAGEGCLLDPDALRWWQIAGTWFWAVICAMQARRHLDGWVESLEHAVIGRRVCESEWDMLELLP